MGSIGFGNPGSDLLPNPIDHQPRRHSNQHLDTEIQSSQQQKKKRKPMFEIEIILK